MVLRRVLGGALQKSQGFGSKKTPPHGLVGLRANAKPAMPQGTGIASRTGAHLHPVASTAHALPANGPQGLTRGFFRRGGAFLARQCGKPPGPKGALFIRAGANRLGRRTLALQTKLPDGCQRTILAPAGIFCAFCVRGHQDLEAPQHFLYFLPLPQGQGSLRPTLGSCLR